MGGVMSNSKGHEPHRGKQDLRGQYGIDDQPIYHRHPRRGGTPHQVRSKGGRLFSIPRSGRTLMCQSIGTDFPKSVIFKQKRAVGGRVNEGGCQNPPR